MDETNENAVSEIFYHRECRSNFTHKKTLDRLTAKNAIESANKSDDFFNEKPRSSHKQPTSNKSCVYEKICTFVTKVKNTYIRRSHTRETFIQARSLCVDEKVRAVATAKMDDKILAVTSRELVAAEAHYHRSCYRDYTRDYYPQFRDNSAVELTEDDQTYADAEEDA